MLVQSITRFVVSCRNHLFLAVYLMLNTHIGVASEGETYRLSRPISEQVNVANNFLISEDGNSTYYMAHEVETDVVRVFQVPTLGGASRPVSGIARIGSVGSELNALDFIIRSPGSVMHSGRTDFDGGSPSLYEVFIGSHNAIGGGASTLVTAHQDLKTVPTRQFQLSPDKRYAVYTQGRHLYSRELGVPGTVWAKLSDIAGVFGTVADFKIAPNGRIFFRIDEPADEYELYSIMPNGNDLRYHDGGYIPAIDANTSVLDYQISADNRHLVYRVRDYNSILLRRIELHSGSYGVGLIDVASQITKFLISENSRYVVYRADKNTQGVFELFVTSFDGSSHGKLNPSPFANTADITDFAISPDSNRVIYTADQDNDNVRELYSTSIIRNGGPFIIVVKLNPNYSGSQDISSFSIGVNSQFVYYRANQDNTSRNEIYRVSIHSGSSTKLNHQLEAGENVGLFKLSQDNSRLVYTLLKSGPDQLYSVEIGGGEAVNLTQIANGIDTSALGVVDFKLSPDNETVVFTAGPFGQKQLFAHSFRRGNEVCIPIRAQNNKIAMICL